MRSRDPNRLLLCGIQRSRHYGVLLGTLTKRCAGFNGPLTDFCSPPVLIGFNKLGQTFSPPS
jgi:hypothetical protein